MIFETLVLKSDSYHSVLYIAFFFGNMLIAMWENSFFLSIEPCVCRVFAGMCTISPSLRIIFSIFFILKLFLATADENIINLAKNINTLYLAPKMNFP